MGRITAKINAADGWQIANPTAKLTASVLLVYRIA
jgi:hypothetical protein